MKSLILIAAFFISIQAFAYTESECDKNDVVTVNVTVTKDRFEPRVIYLKERDKVCMFVTAVDYGVSFTVDRQPISVSVASGRTGFTYFTVPRSGEFSIRCHGGCALGVDAKIIVQPKAEFEKFENRDYREQAESYRKKVGNTQEPQPYHKDSDYRQNDYSSYSNSYRRDRDYHRDAQRQYPPTNQPTAVPDSRSYKSADDQDRNESIRTIPSSGNSAIRSFGN